MDRKLNKLMEGTIGGVPTFMALENLPTGGRQIVYSVNNIEITRDTFIALAKMAGVMADQEIAANLAAVLAALTKDR